jgi:hypothetical protein
MKHQLRIREMELRQVQANMAAAFRRETSGNELGFRMMML